MFRLLPIYAMAPCRCRFDDFRLLMFDDALMPFALAGADFAYAFASVYAADIAATPRCCCRLLRCHAAAQRECVMAIRLRCAR